MASGRTMTAFLLESGRITGEDVERALEHQRRNGGYLGEALVELGLVRREEIDWALASQLDLPFIFPDAGSADREATRLVTAEWALAHLAVPIVHGGDTITVVVTDPLDRGTLDELAERTGLGVEMALASASRIRELIRGVYGGTEPPAPEPETPVALEDFLTEALARGAERIGVSARGTRAQGWWTAAEVGERRRLEEGWDEAVEAIIDPAPLAAAHAAEGSVAAFGGTLRQAGGDVAVDVQAMTSLSGAELLLRPHRRLAVSLTGWELPGELREDLRLLAAGGRAVVGVTGSETRVEGLVPKLPSLVMGESVRAAHVAMEADLPGVFTLRPRDAGDAGFAGTLAAYAFDALTVDLPLDDDRLGPIVEASALTFVRVPAATDAAALRRAGIHWLLTVPEGRGDPGWDLRSTHR